MEPAGREGSPATTKNAQAMKFTAALLPRCRSSKQGLRTALCSPAVAIHWVGGQHTELRVARIGIGRYTDEARRPTAVEALRQLGGHWPDQQLAVTLNRMRCRCPESGTWTSGRVKALRTRLGIPAYDPAGFRAPVVTLDEAARRLSICVGSVYRLIREGVLPATQLMPAAPWQIAVAALESEAVQIGVRAVQQRRPRNLAQYQDERALRLPGF